MRSFGKPANQVRLIPCLLPIILVSGSVPFRKISASKTTPTTSVHRSIDRSFFLIMNNRRGLSYLSLLRGHNFLTKLCLTLAIIFIMSDRSIDNADQGRRCAAVKMLEVRNLWDTRRVIIALWVFDDISIVWMSKSSVSSISISTTIS